MEVNETDLNVSKYIEEILFNPLPIPPPPSRIIGEFIVKSFAWLLIIGFVLMLVICLLGELVVSYSIAHEIESALGWIFAGGMITLAVMAKFSDYE